MLCAVVVYHRVVPEEEGGHFEEITLNLYRVDCLRLRGLMRVADKKKRKEEDKKRNLNPGETGKASLWNEKEAHSRKLCSEQMALSGWADTIWDVVSNFG